jgi:hypothetical protein
VVTTDFARSIAMIVLGRLSPSPGSWNQPSSADPVSGSRSALRVDGRASSFRGFALVSGMVLSGMQRSYPREIRTDRAEKRIFRVWITHATAPRMTRVIHRDLTRQAYPR